MNLSKPLHTRIAPSPTGDMHLGTVRTAYFNWLAARATGGRFLLRIDDTDLSRSKEEHVETIKSVMSWLKLDYDQVVKQSDRFEEYKLKARMLVDAGWADRGAERSLWSSGTESSRSSGPTRWSGPSRRPGTTSTLPTAWSF